MRKQTLFFLFLLTAWPCALCPSLADRTPFDVEENVIRYLIDNNPSPSVASIGGDWVVFAASRAGLADNEWQAGYREQAEAYVAEKGSAYLHRVRSTENARVVLALTAIGQDAQNVAGFDLLSPLSDWDYVTGQGLNGIVYALLAWDTKPYYLPEGEAETAAMKKAMVDELLLCELEGGGWTLMGTVPDPDMTAMVLQALAPYADTRSDVKEAAMRGIEALSALQEEDGGFSSYGVSNCESTAQVLCAMSALHVSVDDERLVKNQNTVLDALLSYCEDTTGAFCHVRGGQINEMATEQAAYALCAYVREVTGQPSLYQMTDALPKSAVTLPFTDVLRDDWFYSSVYAAYEAGYIAGVSDTQFAPQKNMTRAMLVTLLWRMDNEAETEPVCPYWDVQEGDWFCRAVCWGTAHRITNGTAPDRFSPDASVTREQAVALLIRYARYKGIALLEAVSSPAFLDADSVSPYAVPAVSLAAACGLVQGENGLFYPHRTLTRAEAVTLLTRLNER